MSAHAIRFGGEIRNYYVDSPALYEAMFIYDLCPFTSSSSSSSSSSSLSFFPFLSFFLSFFLPLSFFLSFLSLVFSFSSSRSSGNITSQSNYFRIIY